MTAARDQYIEEVDLALAALRRVILRGANLSTEAPAKLVEALVKPIAPPKGLAVKPSTPKAKASYELVSEAGLLIEITAMGGTITFRGTSARVTRRQAQLAHVLAKASPNFIARDEATARAWPDLAASSRKVTISEALRILANAVAPNIKVEQKPGYGLRLLTGESA